MKRLVMTFAVLMFTGQIFAQSFTSAIVHNERMVQEFVSKDNIPGLSIAVYYKGKPVWLKEFGLANVELNVPVTRQTKFRIASISKSLTGTAIALLVDRGLIDLNAPLSKYLADIPEAWKSITVFQVCEHSSGIGHYRDAVDGSDTTYYRSTAEALQVFRNRPLLHKPGEKRTYSSYAYTVLAAIIEKVSGMDFLTFMQENLFTPLHMSNTVADHKNIIIPNRSAFYSYKANEIVPAKYVDLSSRWAGSGYLSTAEDLARFGAIHCKPGFLSKNIITTLYNSRTLGDSSTAAETLGWGPRKDWQGRTMLWNNGGTPGCTGGLLIFPDQELSIAMLCNVNGAPYDRGELQMIALRFLAEIEGKKVQEISDAETGTYAIDVTIGSRNYKGQLQLQTNKNTNCSGLFTLNKVQDFTIGDAFKVDGQTWIAALGERNGAIDLGILPIRIEKATNDELSGSLLRIGAQFSGKKIK